MFKGHMQTGLILGAGAAVNVACGFEPDLVFLINSRGATETVTVYGGAAVVRFDSGSDEILPGDTLVDASAGGSFRVVGVTLTSGAWDDGDAAGYLEIKYVSGTVTDNNVLNRRRGQNRAAAADVATVNGAVIHFDVDIDSEVGTPASRFVLPYAGADAETARGFTVAGGALPSSEFVRWIAFGTE